MKRAHPTPAAVAMAACLADGRCRCSERGVFNRNTCEARYRVAIRSIIDRYVWGRE